jgi:spore coat polysaccharide biosynthesis protein SpsF
MSSRRFPGKVLAPFKGVPIIRHVLDAAKHVVPPNCVVVLTSREQSDDPLAAYLSSEGEQVFRGDLENVFERFCQCLERFPCRWILRLSADSPRLDPGLLRAVVDQGLAGSCDLVTTIFPRTYPKGQNAELIRAESLMNVRRENLTSEDREHVTAYFYRHADRYRIVNVASTDPSMAGASLAVDTVDDLSRLENLSDQELRGYIARLPLVQALS